MSNQKQESKEKQQKMLEQQQEVKVNPLYKQMIQRENDKLKAIQDRIVTINGRISVDKERLESLKALEGQAIGKINLINELHQIENTQTPTTPPVKEEEKTIVKDNRNPANTARDKSFTKPNGTATSAKSK